MDLTFLSKYAIPVIVGICLCLGFIIKYAIKTDKVNRFIPLIMGVLGLGIAIWIEKSVTPEIILKGLFSGLASTGLYEAFRNIITKKSKESEK